MLSRGIVLGIDFGTDSGRAVLFDIRTGEELAVSIEEYPRWKQGLYCAPGESQFRHHPQDYLDVLTSVVNNVLDKYPDARSHLIGIGTDATGSTPVAVDENGTPLSLLPQFSENPDAMFVLWKDHTGKEANDDLNHFSGSRETDYTRSRLCGNYSIEHFWTKALHIFRNFEIRKEAVSFVELSDWIPGELTGNTSPKQLRRGMGVASSRVLWNRIWGGYPPNDFFASLDSVLDGVIDTFDPKAFTADQPVGKLSEKWKKTWGIKKEVVVSAGLLDCHAAAIGAGVKDHTMIEIIGTSTVAITVGPFKEEGIAIPGVPQQALHMILPGEMGYEGGQSAFGDLYAWFKDFLFWPVQHIISQMDLMKEGVKKEIIEEIEKKLLAQLTIEAEKLPTEGLGLVSTDWINGRRSPDADFDLKCTIAGLTLSSTAPDVYKSLVEATAFGAKSFIEKFIQDGGHFDEIVAVGGISHKSPFVMQVLSDVIGLPIKVLKTQQAGSLGSAMCAAAAAKAYPSLPEAQSAMKGDLATTYKPEIKLKNYYQGNYNKYLKLEKVKNLIR